MDKTVFILRGIPGAGKSTLAKILAEGRDAVICSADDYFVDSAGVYMFDISKIKQAHNACYNKFLTSLNNSVEVVIVDNTHTMEWEFEKYLITGEDAGYKVFTIIVENRGNRKTIHGTPADKIETMRRRFEVKL